MYLYIIESSTDNLTYIDDRCKYTNYNRKSTYCDNILDLSLLKKTVK